MKLKFLLRIVEKLFRMTEGSNGPRADMYLPERLLAMSLIFMCGGLACGVYYIFRLAVWAILCAVLGIALGVGALLCWKNQTIRVISDEQFTYTTMFGNTYTYNFSDIERLRRNNDSLTLFVAGKKVHIESMAILSDRLIDLINKALRADANEPLEKEEIYFKMSAQELLGLSDDELFDAVWSRTHLVVDSYDIMNDGFLALNNEQRIFYAVSYLEMEVNNGGLCQFFVNRSRILAPFVSKYMEIIGATEHKKLYDTFIEKHQINIYDLSSFDCETIEVFQSQYERYPFDEYDDAFYKLEPLQNCLISFVKKHIEKF